MIDAALSGAMGSWSPNVILASFGDAIDRIADRSALADRDFSAATSTGAAASFERALAAEVMKAGDIDRLDIGFDLQNGTVLNKAGQFQQADGRRDRFDSGTTGQTNAVDGASAAGAYRRVDFGDDDASARSSAGGRDGLGQSVDEGDPAAFWIGNRIVDHPAFRSDGSTFTGAPLVEPVPTGRVLFNGDGRPIILPPIDVGPPDEPLVEDGFAGRGRSDDFA